MELKTLRSEIHKLADLVDGWTTPDAVLGIERELVLEKLRMLYDAVRFADVQSVVAAGDETPIEAAVSIDLGDVLSLDPLPVDEPETATEIEVAPVPEMESDFIEPQEAAETITALEPEIAPEPEPVVVSESGPVVLSEPEPEPEITREPIVAAEPEPEPESPFVELSVETAAESEILTPEPVAEQPQQPQQAEPELVATPQTLFGLEADDTTRHRHKQRVIMSLYDTQPQAAPAVAPQPEVEAPVAETPVVEVAARESQPESAEWKAAPQPEIVVLDEDDDVFTLEEVTVTSGAVLGEVINSNRQTLADTLAPQHPKMAEIRPEPVADLHRAIGINDKFLMIRDLFDNDSEAYDEAIGTLNAFDNLDDCMIHIAENYAWNPNSDGAKLLVELLERKFA